MNPDLHLLQRMLLIRVFEEQVAALHAQGLVGAGCSSMGQEASAVGVIDPLRPEDLILTHQRSAGHLLARGADPARLLGERLGRTIGYCKGKGGATTLVARELGVVLAGGLPGGSLAMAPGVALAQRQLGRDGIVCCIFGDGAAASGLFHEALNLAALWSLPLLFVCENNQWQGLVPRRELMAAASVAPAASHHGIGHATVDGNDVRAVREAAAAARALVARDGRPYLLETWTYRQAGHDADDRGAHVDPAERSAWRQRDPIDRLAGRLRAEGRLDGATLDALEAEARTRIAAAQARAAAAPATPVAELPIDVYAG